ncbi:hypothetical protein Plhal304r1_c068g0156181 [Plasmopara halstedii]
MGVTLTLRDNQISLNNAVFSVYNKDRHELLVGTPKSLSVYSKLLTLGGDLQATLEAEEYAQYLFALYLPWLDAYFVVMATSNEDIEYRIMSSDLKTSLMSHMFANIGGQFNTASANTQRRELITADTDGGIKVWAPRAITTAGNGKKFKLVLRVHTAVNMEKKPTYYHLSMSFDGRHIFAATKTKLFLLDAASCHRLPCRISETKSTVSRMECGNSDNSIYIAFKFNLRKVCKYVFVVKGGVVQFQKVAEYEHNQELAVFTESSEYCSSLLVLDVCAAFIVVDVASTQSDNRYSDADVQSEKSAISLPVDSSLKRYIALHTMVASDGRNFAFAVRSTGFCILELVSSNIRGRVPCNKLGCEVSTYYEKSSNNRALMAYDHRFSTTQVGFFQEGISNFHFASIPTLDVSNQMKERNMYLADYVIASDSVIALYSHGLAIKYNLFDNRITTIAPPFQSLDTIATTLVSLPFSGCSCVGIGDSSGAVQIFAISNDTQESNYWISRKQVYANDRVAVLINLTDTILKSHKNVEFSILSVSRRGDVQRWQIKKVDAPSNRIADTDFKWDLLVCFRTEAQNVSTATIKLPEFLFCGFDGGTIECWRLPSEKQIEASHFQQRPPFRVSVVKRVLHAIDLHSTSVLKILCDSQTERIIINERLVTKSFSWVFSYDNDATIFIWSFSLEFFFPHRRIKVHDFIKDIFISQTDRGLNLFAYIDRCVDRVDHLGLGDNEAVKQRLQRAQLLNQREVERHETGGIRSEGHFRASSFTEDASDESQIVHLDVTLPAVESEVTTPQHPCPGTSSAKAFAGLFERASTLIDYEQVKNQTAQIGCDTLQCIQSLSTMPRMDHSPTEGDPYHTRYDSSHDSSQTPRSKNHDDKNIYKRVHVRDTKATYRPVKNSVPSSFQRAKPRVYRTFVNYLHSLPSQTRCAVISTDRVDGETSNTGGMDDDLARIAMPSSTKILHFGVQDKVSVVSLVEDEERFLLDFQPELCRGSKRASVAERTGENSEASNSLLTFPFMSLDLLSNHDRQIELMAASKSKCIREIAKRDDVAVPALEAFESLDISVQVGVLSFTRWFTATPNHQRVREHFLIEELKFAAIDPFIHLELAHAGLSPPEAQHVGQSTSAWLEFVSWYSCGLNTHSQAISSGLVQRRRVEARTEYLKLRLKIISKSERDVQEEVRAGLRKKNREPSQQFFVFEHYDRRSLIETVSLPAWDDTSPEIRLKEIALALMDPVVQFAAMRNDIELPDVSCIDDLDTLTLAEKFMPWWIIADNIHRRDFLIREALEASTNKAIQTMLSRELLAENVKLAHDSDEIVQNFIQVYHNSNTARHTFLKKKMFFFRRQSRIASVAQYGKFPAPLLIETLPLPLMTTFAFNEQASVDKIDIDTFTVDREESNMAIEVELVELNTSSPEYLRDEISREMRCEAAVILLELMAMAHEESMSRVYINGIAQSEEDIQTRLLPKRADFTRSYFFSDLPHPSPTEASSSWQVGSGVDNGDEEYEEKQLQEQEFEHQRLLEERETERFAQLERQAKKARLENEEDEKFALSQRIKQDELSKVLLHQAELEAKRKELLQIAREDSERSHMKEEDNYSNWYLNQLLRNQNGMQLEDQCCFPQKNSELCEDAASLILRLLHEQDLMVAEDHRSKQVFKELQKLESQKIERTTFLSELKSPFCPFYQSSEIPSETFLPRMHWKLKAKSGRTCLKPARAYTIPFEEALVFDELNQVPYLARDSRRFQLLIGMPFRSTNTSKRSRFPTADAIIATQQQQRNLVESNEHQKTTTMTRNDRLLTQIDSSNERIRLPSITAIKNSMTRQAKRQEDFKSQGASDSSRKEQAKNIQHQQNEQTQSLPFFRGNMLVRGRGERRSSHYTFNFEPSKE